MKPRVISGLVLIIALMASASGALAQRSEFAGVGNPVATLFQAENVELVRQINMFSKSHKLSVNLSLASVKGTTSRVSVASDGTEGNDASFGPSISADGRYLAYRSNASNLVSGDTNGWGDIFVYDQQTGETTRVSVASNGTQGNGYCINAAISADGQHVAFDSKARNLVSGDTNWQSDIFVHDLQTGFTERVSVANGGTETNGGSQITSISADGRNVAFESYATNLSDPPHGWSQVFAHDRQTGLTERVSVASDGTVADFWALDPSISADGRYVLFASPGDNLVIGDTNGKGDIFVRDRQTGQTTRVSVASDGTQGNDSSYSGRISADGRYVAFNSSASNLVDGDTNWRSDIFVHDRQTGQTTRASVASDGTEGNNGSYFSSLSADGRYVAYRSSASNLVAGDTNGYMDIFVHDRQTGQTERVSVASDGTEGNDDNPSTPSISGDGRYVAFSSLASNLVIGDNNGTYDIFVHDRGWDTTTTITADTPDPSVVGVPIRVNFMVDGPPGTSIPTGSVTITVEGSVETCNGTLVSGSGSCLITFTSPGIYTLIATYDGDDNFNGSSDTEENTVITVVANDDSYSLMEGTILDPDAPGVLSNDTGEGLTVSSYDRTSLFDGAVTIDLDGSLEYVPATGFAGIDTFSYTMTDGNGDFDTATVEMTVNVKNRRSIQIESVDGTVIEQNLVGTILISDQSENGNRDDLLVQITYFETFVWWKKGKVWFRYSAECANPPTVFGDEIEVQYDCELTQDAQEGEGFGLDVKISIFGRDKVIYVTQFFDEKGDGRK